MGDASSLALVSRDDDTFDGRVEAFDERLERLEILRRDLALKLRELGGRVRDERFEVRLELRNDCGETFGCGHELCQLSVEGEKDLPVRAMVVGPGHLSGQYRLPACCSLL